MMWESSTAFAEENKEHWEGKWTYGVPELGVINFLRVSQM